MKVCVLPDAAQAARAASGRIAARIRERLETQHEVSLGLAGGSTPRDAYRLLAAEPLAWTQVHVFWTDERMVPPAHPDSNFRMVRHALLEPAGIPAENVHRIRGELGGGQAATAYARELSERFGGDGARFDLVVLGLGADAHTASLFPGDPLLEERVDTVGVSQPRANRGPRVSLTLPVLNAATEVLWLVTGSTKASAVRRTLRGPLDPLRVPAQGVDSARAVWYLDRESAGLLRD